MAKPYSLVLLVSLTAILVGCRNANHIRHADYAELTRSVQRSYRAPSPEIEAVAPVSSQLEGAHSVEEYIQFALSQNPDIHAARKRMEAFAHKVPVAASLPDPMMSLTVQPEPVQTASGQQELILSANQKFHWFGKLDARASIAESQTNVARALLAAEELETIAKVKHTYYELYFIQQAIQITTTEQRLLGEIRDVANSRYKTNQTSQQDVLRAELEISNVENELIRLRQRLTSSQARLARILHVAPQTPMLAVDRLPFDQAPSDLERLQEQAVAARPELHAQLAAIRRDQEAVALARLDYKPDVTLGFSWIDVAGSGISPVANGRDAFLLTAGVNLPIYGKRLNSSVRSAEAKAVSSAREYDALRDDTLETVADLFAQVKSHQELLTLFSEDILPKARHTLAISSQAYNVGQVDFLQLIDNWRQLLRYEISERQLDATLRQKLAELEKVIGGAEFSGELVPLPQPLPEPQPNP